MADKKIKEYNLIADALKKANLDFIGQLGCAKANPVILKGCWDSNKQKGVIKVNTKYTPEIKTSLSLIKNINKERVIVDCVGVSGTLKKAKLKFM